MPLPPWRLVSPTGIIHFVRDEAALKALVRQRKLEGEKLDNLSAIVNADNSKSLESLPLHHKHWQLLERVRWLQRSHSAELLLPIIGGDCGYYVKHFCGPQYRADTARFDSSRLNQLLHKGWLWSANEKCTEYRHKGQRVGEGWRVADHAPSDPERYGLLSLPSGPFANVASPATVPGAAHPITTSALAAAASYSAAAAIPSARALPLPTMVPLPSLTPSLTTLPNTNTYPSATFLSIACPAHVVDPPSVDPPNVNPPVMGPVVGHLTGDPAGHASPSTLPPSSASTSAAPPASDPGSTFTSASKICKQLQPAPTEARAEQSTVECARHGDGPGPGPGPGDGDGDGRCAMQMVADALDSAVAVFGACTDLGRLKQVLEARGHLAGEKGRVVKQLLQLVQEAPEEAGKGTSRRRHAPRGTKRKAPAESRDSMDLLCNAVLQAP